VIHTRGREGKFLLPIFKNSKWNDCSTHCQRKFGRVDFSSLWQREAGRDFKNEAASKNQSPKF
jgi:hypothetical protein